MAFFLLLRNWRHFGVAFISPDYRFRFRYSVEMLDLRVQYLQSTITALAGGQIVNDHDFFEIPARNQV
jgi:hypothetical protein